MHSHFAHHRSLSCDNLPEYSDTESDNDRKLPAVAAVEEAAAPPKGKGRAKLFTMAEMRSATKLLEQCEEYMTKSKDGRIPKRFDPLLCRIISINDRMDEAFGRKWITDAERAKVAASTAEKRARRKLFMKARKEVCDRYTALRAGLEADCRLKAPRHSLQKIIDQVTQEMNLPPDMEISSDIIHSDLKRKNKG